MANKNTIRNRKAGVFGNAPYDLKNRLNRAKKFKTSGVTVVVPKNVIHSVPPLQKPGAGKIIKKFKAK